MGVDNDVKNVFGILLYCDDFKKISKVVGNDVDLMDMVWDEQYDTFNEKYPQLYLGYASPYYDSGYDEYTFYIGIGKEQRSYSLNDLKKLITTWENSGYRECLKEMGIDFEEPEIIALPHIY